MEVTYRMQNGYQVPNLLMPQTPEVHLGKYAELRREYLKKHRRVLYTNLKTSGKLTEHLAEIEQTARKMVEQTVAQMLDAIHDGLYAKAKKNLEDNTYACATLEEVKEKMAAQGGFAKTMWCGDEACEVRMKEEAGVSSRCIPFEQEHLGDTCAICGKPAKHMVYWGVAY